MSGTGFGREEAQLSARKYGYVVTGLASSY